MTTSSRLRGRHRAAAAVLALLVWLVAALPAMAHSELVSSIPAAGSTVTSASGLSIVLSFSEALTSGSKADVVGPGGAPIGTATIDPGDNTKLSWTPTTALPAGSYAIRWTSIATDGDVLRGTIPFTVAAGSAAPPASPAASPAAGDSSTGVGVLVPVVAALVIIALLALTLLRRRRWAA